MDTIEIELAGSIVFVSAAASMRQALRRVLDVLERR